MRKEIKSALPLSLREKSLLLLKQRPSKPNFVISDEKVQQIIFELELHQIELELQYEEFRMAQEKAQNEADKYEEIYNFAPFSFFELSKKLNSQPVENRALQFWMSDLPSLLKVWKRYPIRDKL